MMLDFTSSHYLGFRHASRSLRPWAQLTTGMPAALREQADVRAIAATLAKLQGLERATLARSTLHLFWDLFGMLPTEQFSIYIDAQAYPIAQWGAERAAGRGMIVKRFPHRDVNALHDLLQQQKSQLRPVIVTNGICICCGCTTPLQVYQECVRAFGGVLIVDDTQALGILGASPSSTMPYGLGGGGSLRHLDLNGEGVLVICSLAKAFSAPIASLSGSDRMIRQYETLSRTRVHCSPPSQADLAAVEHALSLNSTQGDIRRSALLKRVCLFKEVLTVAGLSTKSGLFPIQTLEIKSVLNLVPIYRRLLKQGVQAVLHAYSSRQTSLSFILTASHPPEHVEFAVKALLVALQGERVVQEPG